MVAGGPMSRKSGVCKNGIVNSEEYMKVLYGVDALELKKNARDEGSARVSQAATHFDEPMGLDWSASLHTFLSGQSSTSAYPYLRIDKAFASSISRDRDPIFTSNTYSDVVVHLGLPSSKFQVLEAGG
jgi:hypothetical protein